MSIKRQYIAEQCEYFLPIIGAGFQHDVQPVLKEEDDKLSQTENQKKKETSSSLKIRRQIANLIKQICRKYILSADEDEMELLIKKVLQVREISFGGNREISAVVVFCQYSDKIQLSIKDFCKKNSLRNKVFNKKYKAYYQIFPYPIRGARSDDESTKNEEKYENQEIEEGFPQMSQATVTTPQQAINLIYDSIFTSHYFQTHRREIIQKIALSYQKVDRTKLDSMEQIATEPSKMYYVLYGLLKEYGANICFMNFRDAVFNATNLTLKLKSAQLVESLFKQKPNEDCYQPEYTYEGYDDYCSFGVQDEAEDFFMS